jgi:NAD+ kinase
VAHGREKQFLLSLDSRVMALPYGTEIHVSRAPFRIYFIRLEGYTFIRTLRRKLFWGYDNRNT